jgi:hypothetical protein
MKQCHWQDVIKDRTIKLRNNNDKSVINEHIMPLITNYYLLITNYFSTIFQSSIPLVSDEKFTPILYSLRLSCANGCA